MQSYCLTGRRVRLFDYMFWFNLFFVFVLLIYPEVLADGGTGPHIADVNILLPPKMTRPVEYRLQGTDGCFTWSWDHHDILSVMPEYNKSNHCSTSARVRSIASYSGRKETAIYAADVYTGVVIRCKVFIDMFSRIQIFHNSIKLDLDGLATLRVRAFDSEDNVFSSLVGLKFLWQLMPEGDGGHHLDHVPLKDSPLSDCSGFCGDLSIQINLEESGVFSDLFVIKGIGVGHEMVSVQLLEQYFVRMEDKIVLTVAEAMSLHPPSPVFMLVGSTVNYTLKVVRANIPQVVNLPSPFHRWSTSNSSVSQVNSMMGSAHALALGETNVIVEDTRVAGHSQVSSLHVVLPDFLCLYILPLYESGDPVDGIEAIKSNARWYIVSGRQYLLQIKVYSRGPDVQEIYMTENEDINLHNDQSQHWKSYPVLESFAVKYGRRTSRILDATSEGSGKLSASLAYSSGPLGTREVLKASQEILVCGQVMIRMVGQSTMSSTIVLPWAPAIHQEVKLNAIGGCAERQTDYTWVSSDVDVVSVSASGVVQAKKPGKVVVKVVSVYDALNFNEMTVQVTAPSSMVMLPNFPVEAVVGSHLEAFVTLKAPDGAYFYRCDAFRSSIQWNTGSESFVILNSTRDASLADKLENIELLASAHGPPCASTYVYAADPGRTVLQATLSTDYHRLDTFSRGHTILKASTSIASYLPISVRQAGDGNQHGGYWVNLSKSEGYDHSMKLDYLYLVPGTYMDVELIGGPEQWGKGVDFIESFDILYEDNGPRDEALVQQVLTSYGHQYRVMCRALGNFILVFRRGNLAGVDHSLPVVAEIQLPLTCSFPSSVVVLADEPVNALDAIKVAFRADRGPGNVRSSPVAVANGRTIRVSAVGVSSSGKAFANSSSLSLSWELKKCDGLAFWDESYNLPRIKSNWERFLCLTNASGLCFVRATVNDIREKGYHPRALSSETSNVLTDALHLQIVSTLVLSPEFSLLVFNPDAKMKLSISGGSCDLDYALDDSQVLEVIWPVRGIQCTELMLSPRGLGTATITVYDIGLAPPISASSVVEVAEVDWIKITSGEEISLMEGSIQSLSLLAGIDDGKIFDPTQYTFMNIRVHIEDDIINLVDGDDLSSLDPEHLSAHNFTIYGRYLGFTTLYVSARQYSGRQIFSQQVKVEVYAPPIVHPLDIFLVPGASYVLTLEGGPAIGMHVQYTSMDDSIVVVNAFSGRLSAMSPGNTSVVAFVYGSGQTVICEAYGKVRVGVPSSMILNVQSEQLAVDREMPIFPLFPEGDLFSFYELCKNYHWTTENTQVLSFQEAEKLSGDNNYLSAPTQKETKSTTYMNQNYIDFINVLYGRSAGRTKVALAFSCDFVSASFSQTRSYDASLSIWVVPDPPLALGIPITWVLPPHYTTSDLLPSSSGSYSDCDTQIQKSSITYSVLTQRHFGHTDVEVHKNLISIYCSKLRTGDSHNVACILAKDDSTGRTEVASCVRVAEVTQIRIEKEFAFHVIDLAVGAEIQLFVTYRDELGNSFREAHNVALVDAETNYRDIISVNISRHGNGSAVNIKAIQHGRALVRVRMNGNQHKSDFIMISVGAYIYPRNPVIYLGSHVNFTIEGLNDQASGRWLSDNESVITVLSGKALAVGEGTALVLFQGPGFTLQTMVTVLNGNVILVNAPRSPLTNIPPSKGYKFLVKFSHMFEDRSRSFEVPYDCRVEPSFVGHTMPWRDLDTGETYCLFFPHSPEHLAHAAPKLKDSRQDISISIQASLREASDVSGSASALFIGGFVILEKNEDLLQLNFTPDSNRSLITAVGNTDIGLNWHHRDLLMVSQIYKENSRFGGCVKYEIKVLSAKPFKDKITFTLPANGQKLDIDIQYELGNGVAVQTFDLKFWASVISGIALFVLSVLIFVCYVDRPERPPPPVRPTVGTNTPVTPVRNSLNVTNEQSPRTPQPFMEYVRRTIDETPYYRREGRRRFNPQNTY